MALKLRVGEAVGLEAGILGDDGSPMPNGVVNPAFTLAQTSGAVRLNAVAGDDFATDVEALEPGTDVVDFAADDPFFDPITASEPVTVLDANALVISGGSREQGKLVFKADDAGTLPTEVLRAIPIDERTATDRDYAATPAYATSEEAWSCTPAGGVLFAVGSPGTWSQTATGTLDVYVMPGTRAAGTIHVSAKNASGVTITGSLEVVVHSPSSASLTRTAVHNGPGAEV